MAIHAEIKTYNRALAPQERLICDLLVKELSKGLAGAENKLWHGHPVWFLEGNPIVGYSKRKVGIVLLFWSGQSFEEPGLEPEGSFKAAQVRYTDVQQLRVTHLRRWLKKAKAIQWDYKNIVKRKGLLVRI